MMFKKKKDLLGSSTRIGGCAVMVRTSLSDFTVRVYLQEVARNQTH